MDFTDELIELIGFEGVFQLLNEAFEEECGGDRPIAKFAFRPFGVSPKKKRKSVPFAKSFRKAVAEVLETEGSLAPSPWF
jgi:hypothetical protein